MKIPSYRKHSTRDLGFAEFRGFFQPVNNAGVSDTPDGLGGNAGDVCCYGGSRGTRAARHPSIIGRRHAQRDPSVT